MDVAGKAHAFVDDLDAPVLAAGDRHHLERVLRLRDGDRVTIGDGCGRWRACAFGRELVAIGEVQYDERPEPEITIGFALVKGTKPDLVVQKLTEIGVDVIVPFVAERSVVRWDADKRAQHHARLVAIAREAAMQSRRAWLPTVEPVAEFAALAARPGVALAERGGAKPDLDHPVVLVGPEGGWSDTERQDIPTVALGPNVLRAETAAIVAASALCGLRASLF